MKDFDEFHSWIEFEKRYLKGHKKQLLFDKDYLWIKDEKLLSSVFVFYYTYYHFGIEFLLEKAEEANYPPWRKNTIIQLINLCQDIVHEINMEFYGKLARYAKDSGVKIAIENMWQVHPVTGRICDDVCADPNELALYYDTLGDSEAFTVCLDIGHVALCGREPEDAVRILGNERLGALHVHDVDYIEDCHTLPGTRRINFDKVCMALAEIDYKGDFTLEADSFLMGYPDDFKTTALGFMAQTAKYYAEKTEKYRSEYLIRK